MALPMLAQYSGEAGFYRIKNNGAAKRYISLVNDRIEKRQKEVDPSTTWSQYVTVYALKTVKDPISDPGSVLYISGPTGDLTLQAQGMNTKNLIGQYHLNCAGLDEEKTLFSEYKGVKVNMVDDKDEDVNKDSKILIITDKYKNKYNIGSYATWRIEKIDNDKQYFGVAPELQVGDKYYTTLFTSFAYELPAGVKAYVVDAHAYDCQEPVAELKEVTGTVPAATPVILECTSNKTEDNKLKPLANSPAAVAGNELKGLYFCFYLTWKNQEYDPADDDHDWGWYAEVKNVVNYNANTMRVLGVVNGQLALVPAKNAQLEVTNKGKYLPANKAYFTIAESEAETTSKGIKLLDKEAFEAAKALPKQETLFIEQKDVAKKKCDDLAKEGDDDHCRELIDKAKKDIDDLKFNQNKSLDDNIAALNAIADQLANDLETYRASGIKRITQSEATDAVWYDLQGRRLQGAPLQKGIYIYRGKKVINN
jgi:hypothetical protein